jgi:hypothetical protein
MGLNPMAVPEPIHTCHRNTHNMGFLNGGLITPGIEKRAALLLSYSA